MFYSQLLIYWNTSRRERRSRTVDCPAFVHDSMFLSRYCPIEHGPRPCSVCVLAPVEYDLFIFASRSAPKTRCVSYRVHCVMIDTMSI